MAQSMAKRIIGVMKKSLKEVSLGLKGVKFVSKKKKGLMTGARALVQRAYLPRTLWKILLGFVFRGPNWKPTKIGLACGGLIALRVFGKMGRGMCLSTAH